MPVDNLDLFKFGSPTSDGVETWLDTRVETLPVEFLVFNESDKKETFAERSKMTCCIIRKIHVIYCGSFRL